MTNTVYFDPAVGGDGSTVTDDTNATTGLANGGHRTRFVPALSETVAVAAYTVGRATAAASSATAAAASAASAVSAASTNGTSTSSVAIGLGSKSFTTQSGKNWVVGMPITVADSSAPATNSMFGTVTSYSGTSLVINSAQVAGSGTLTAWTISVSGPLSTGVFNELKGTDIASAATVNLDTASGNFVHITGTTNITAFTISSGRERTVVFNGVLTITNNATTLILPGGVDIVTAAGDSMIIRGDDTGGGQSRVVAYTRASVIPGVGTVKQSFRTANTILGVADRGSYINVTSGTFTQTLTAAATLGAGWFCYFKNSGSGVITLDPSGSETIDTLATRNSYGQECVLLLTDGSNWFTEVLHPFYFKTITTATFVMPSGYIELEADLVGGGGQGGSGKRGAAGAVRAGGAAGGTPSRFIKKLRNIAAGTSITVTIGAGGTTGGAAVTADNTVGNDGQAGGNTTFGTLMTAYGGAAGKGGSGSNVATSGSGAASAGTSTNSSNNLTGGNPSSSTYGGDGSSVNGSANNIGFGGSGLLNTTSSGGNSEYGGASSGSGSTTSTSASSGGSSIFGVSGAGVGGWITDTNTLPATGGTAGLSGTYVAGGGAAGGTCGASPTAGTNGTAAATDDVCGGSGGGGGSTITAGQTGKAGGNGAAPGGAGGGGGAVLNGQNSGAGGTGADGRAIIKGIV